jgi:hypothetical protein
VYVDGWGYDAGCAREAYRELFAAMQAEYDEGGFPGAGTPEELIATDMGEAKHRYLRAVWDSEPAATRAAVLLAAMENTVYLGDTPNLAALEATRREPLSELEAELPDLLARLTAVQAGYGFGTQARRLLADVPSGVAVSTGSPSSPAPSDQQADAYRDWIDAPERRFVLLWLSVAVGMGWIVAVFVDVRRRVSVPATARASRTSSSSHGGHRRSATPRGRGTTLRRSTMPSPVRSPRDAGTGARRRRRLQLGSRSRRRTPHRGRARAS